MAGERGSFQTDKTTKTAMLSHRAPSLRTNKNIKTYWFWKQTSCENTTNTIRVFVSRSSFPQPLSISNRLTHPYRSPQRPTSSQSSTSRSIPFVSGCTIHYASLRLLILTHITPTRRCTGTACPSGPCWSRAFFPVRSLSYIYLRDDAIPTARRATSQVVFSTHLLAEVVFTTDKQHLHRPRQNLRDFQRVIEGLRPRDIVHHA